MTWQKKSVFFVVVMLTAGIVLGANAAFAEDLSVSFGVPASVTVGVTFDITVYVTNNSQQTIIFNKVAAGYGLEQMRIKGPYEVNTAEHSLGPGASTSFSFSFRIFWGNGTIVPVAVILAKDSYQNQNIKGGGIVGIKVN